ncbi:phosphate-starvation-inducible PsiE family protein [Acidithiobacillus sp. IBUN Pt1247-S3]|uniref:phosphate-starvation-inducible PsiE family protein n=1 Tax=Acidithiobacillus sp. IBUN Pt1247-S3 TaxID=3166642 RepID=UPI0034E4AA68
MKLSKNKSNIKQNTYFLGELREQWNCLTYYERFEQIISIFLSFLLILVILVTIFNLSKEVFIITFNAILNSISIGQIRNFFGDILTLLIAMEFNHTIFHSIKNKGQIVRVKTVVLVAILAISRQFIVLDVQPTSPFLLIAFAISILFLGIVYHLMDKRDHHSHHTLPDNEKL